MATPEDIDILIKRRRALRGHITKSVSDVDGDLTASSADDIVLQFKVKKLGGLLSKITSLDNLIMDLMLQRGDTEDDISNETETAAEYEDKIQLTIERLQAVLSENLHRSSASGSDRSSLAGSVHKRTYKLPKVEIKKFNGEVTEWLGWWAQFKKIHEDNELHTSDKFQYLVQSMVPGTSAKALVERFLQTEENYSAVIEALKERYGRPQLLRKVYVRELQRMVISTAKHHQVRLIELYDKLEAHLAALNSLGKCTDPSEFLYPIVESCLPEETLIAWQRSSFHNQDDQRCSNDKSELDCLMQFLRSEVEAEQQRTLAKTGYPEPHDTFKRRAIQERPEFKTRKAGISTAASLNSGMIGSCIFCERNHNGQDCVKAQAMSHEEKKQKLKDRSCCYICFGRNHCAKKCKAVVQCIICSRRHHTVMCERKALSTVRPKEHCDDAQGTSAEVTTVNANKCCVSGDVLLKTLKVLVRGRNGRHYEARLLFDEGSQRSYIKTAVVDSLDGKVLKTFSMRNALFGGEVSDIKCKKVHLVTIEGLDNQNHMEVKLINEDKIAESPRIPSGPWMDELVERKIFLPDLTSSSSEIEILIGSDLRDSMMTGKRIRLSCGITAVETIFGWTLSGEIPQRANDSSYASTIISLFIQGEKTLTDMWSLETIGIKDTAEKVDQKEYNLKVIEEFEKSISRLDDGRYEVQLPWKGDIPNIPTNRDVAAKRLIASMKRLTNDELKSYEKVFVDWASEGLIEVVPETNSARQHFLPHRPVFKSDSLTTPVRPVFDASCKVRNSASLNDCLEKGHNMLELIPSLILRFREKKIGVVSDIRKAFQMISVAKKDRDFQKFLWWKEYFKSTMEYRHTRVVFGMNCSPFLLAIVLHFHLTRNCPEYKETAALLLKSFYVDNLVLSFDTVEEYQIFKREAIDLMGKAKMELRQWESNIDEHVDCSISSVLGLKWHKQRDELFCRVTTPEGLSLEKATKRRVLSLLSRIYDPIGFLCPALLLPKLLLRESWAIGLKWDEEWNDTQSREFHKWLEDVRYLEDVRIPRYVFGDYDNIQFHCFTDASRSAYAAAVFVRISRAGKCYSHLLMAKSRLAPMDTKGKCRITIPRLEILGCLIGARLMQMIKEAYGFPDIPTFYWTDSTVVIAWIERNGDWGTFVQNRVTEIRRLIAPCQLRYVPGHMNPADLPSRGCSPMKLLSSRWWEGPAWLCESEKSWPKELYTPNEDEVQKETRKTVQVAVAIEKAIPNPKFSAYMKNVRVAAWIRRFLNNCKNKKIKCRVPYLTLVEMDLGEMDIIKAIQQRTFPANLSIKGLNVHKGRDGLLHTTTRLTYRDDFEAFKSPILLPSDDPHVKQLIECVHRTYCHAGTQFVLNKIREKFWIIRGRKTVGNVIRNCMVCKRFVVKNIPCDPAPLPLNRVDNMQAAFQTTGVDLAGPILLKGNKKVWIVLYTCAVYRGIHLDWVDSLSADEFLDALERFTWIIGRPCTICSDNGTNFVGTENLMKKLNWNILEERFSIKRIVWKFNPPTAAWWGGFWERLIRSVKDLLRRMLGTAKLTAKGLTQCLAAVSYVMNNRPLTTLTEQDDDLTPLTPHMFMRDLPVAGLPEREVITTKHLQDSYQKIQYIKTALKKRFRREYLSQLIQRKNETRMPHIEEGSVVLVGNDNKKRVEWLLGKIVGLIPGRDGKTRVARVRTINGDIIRPLQRLYPLEVSMSDHLQVPPTRTESRGESPDVGQDVQRTRSGRIVRKPKTMN